MRLNHYALLAATFLPAAASAQCPAGELEVTIDVLTDDYGNETYWQLVPFGNTCGQSPIFIGGNTGALNCNSGGGQTSPAGGYASNTTISTGPWCLTEGAQYNIVSIDSYGDGQATFRVYANGGSIAEFNQSGGLHIFTFTVQEPVPIDMSVTALTTPLFNRIGLPTAFTGTVRNMGSETVTDFTLNVSLYGALSFTQDFTGLSIPSGNRYEFTVNGPWTPSVLGAAELSIWATNINGQSDGQPANDAMGAALWVNAAIPDLVPDYLALPPTMTVVADDDEDLLVPRDLAFHPDPARDELWVINKDVENSGGSTVRFFEPGQPTQTQLWQRDPNAWHFMSLPTGIAFGDNGDFSTCPGVYDANHNGGAPFTGITLWSSDPAIYAQNIFGGLGSHLDMLHVTPHSQGIAHERWNRYWVVDGYNHDVVMHDFRTDHGPGNDYHGDAVIRRYAGIDIQRDPNDHIVSHCEFDKRNGWLYVVDHGNQRVVRLNTQTGTVSGPGSFGPYESYVEYSQMSGHIWETVATTGLVQPAGIAISGDHLLVSDHANGDIVVYDITEGSGFPVVGTIQTNSPGIMGIEVGPDGHLWFVNATTHQLVRIDADENVGIAHALSTPLSVFPNPANDRLFISGAAGLQPDAVVHVIDATGRIALTSSIALLRDGIDIADLAPGAYTVSMTGRKAASVVIAR